jgi:hypothetical protein
LITGYVYAKHANSTSGKRLASALLPLAFLLLAIFSACNAFNMISKGRVSVIARVLSSPQSYNSGNFYFWFLAALQVGAAIFFLSVALKSWQRRNEA